MTFRAGFHLGNLGSGPDDGSRRLISVARPQALLAMENVHPSSLDGWLESNYRDSFLILRKHFDAGGTKADPHRVMNWVNGQLQMLDNYLNHSDYIRTMYNEGRVGVKIFNEPNFDFEGFGSDESNMKLYNHLFCIATEQIKKRFSNTKAILYSLAPGNGDCYFRTDRTNSHYWYHGPEAAVDNPTQLQINQSILSCLTKDAKEAADWLGVHIYPNHDDWNELYKGRRFEQYWKFVPKKLQENTFILEASVGDNMGQDVRSKVTSDWLSMLKTKNGIKGVTLWWLRNGDNTWEKHFYTEPDGKLRPVANTIVSFNNTIDSTPPIPDTLPDNVDLIDVLRNSAWNNVGVAYNKEAYFPKYALRQDLGRPVTNEIYINFGSRRYVYQAFDKGIVYSEVVDGNVVIERTNHFGWMV